MEVVRRKMTEEHAHSTRQALHALAQEKDDALSEARQTWEREQSSLREKVTGRKRSLSSSILQYISRLSPSSGS